MSRPRATVGACEACGTAAGPRVSLHFHARLRAALCHRCKDQPQPEWVAARLERIASGKFPLVLLALLLLSGCAGIRQINPGAAIPAYAVDHVHMASEWQRVTGTPLTRSIAGFAAFDPPAVWVGDWLPKYAFAGVLLHEAGGHLVEQRTGGDPWRVIDAMDAPGFRCASDEAQAEREALERARAEAARRGAIEGLLP